MTDKLLIDRELLERAASMELDTTARSIRIQDQLRAILAQPAQQGEAVEVARVVSYLSACADGYDPDAPHPGPPEPLMTVAQHQRIVAALSAQQSAQHPDDAAVDRFAAAMKAKLARCREKGRHGWQTASAAHLSSLLYHHMYKADPLDVANLAMMLHQNGQAIELPHEARKPVAQQAATVAIEPKPLDVIGYASPGQIEILRSLPRTGGMKLKGRKDDRYSEPVVLLSDARAALISLAARCQQEGAFKACLECGYQDGHDEICQFHATNRKQGQSSHVSVSRELLEKVCDPKSSTNRQEGRKSIRTLLKGRDPAGQYNHKRIGWELERTAMGDGYYGNALRVAKDIPGLTDQDRAVLDRYATGAQQGTDHIALQDIAMRVYAAQGEGGDQ